MWVSQLFDQAMYGWLDQESSRGMKKGSGKKNKGSDWKGLAWAVLGSLRVWQGGWREGGRRWSSGGKKEHSGSRSAAFGLDDKAVGPAVGFLPHPSCDRQDSRHASLPAPGLHPPSSLPPSLPPTFRPPSLHLSLAGWSGRESGMPSLVTCQRSQTPVRPLLQSQISPLYISTAM